VSVFRAWRGKTGLCQRLQSLAPHAPRSSFVRSLGREVRELLWRAVEDPDSLLSPEGVPLLERLIDINVLIDSITYRDPPLWIDQPPPERDLELGIGKHAA